jgi:uncharacterized protein YkwD
VIRVAALLATSVALLAGAADAAADDSRSPVADGSLASEIVVRVNALREDAGARPLVGSTGLARAATAHALAMAEQGFFSHTSSDGTSFTHRITRYYHRTGARSQYGVGETLLWSVRTPTADTVLSWWLASSSHKRTLLSPRFEDIGIAVYRVPAAPGFFGNRDVTLVVLDVGRR